VSSPHKAIEIVLSQARRQFLQLAAGSVGAAAALSAFPSIAKALAIPADRRTGTIKDVRHVVILMQENRSFDHYFGTLPGVRGYGDRFTIPLAGSRNVWEQDNGARVVLPYHLDSKQGNAQRVDGTPHTWEDAQRAWDHGRMTHWPQHKRDQSMGYYTRAELEFQFALADAFTLCDAYHCSLHGGTGPNRNFLWTGTNGPTATRTANVVNEFGGMEPATEGFDWKTYPERLQAAGMAWKVYQNLPDNFDNNALAGFKQFREAARKLSARAPADAINTSDSDAMDTVSVLLKGVANTMTDGGFLAALRSDVSGGTLPEVSWIIAPEAYSEHPGPSSPVQGAWYVQEVLKALTANPEVWSKTVLFVNFDENDGFFDHVPPPAVPSLEDGRSAGLSTCDVSFERFTHAAPAGSREQPAPDGRPYGMGPRVPMFVISPWSRGGWVNSQVFDHTSVIRFLELRFGVREPNISVWRRAVAGDLTSAFNFSSPNDEALPTLSVLSKPDADDCRTSQEKLAPVPVPGQMDQRGARQARGMRPSRALPYELHVSGRATPSGSTMELIFGNTGSVGAVFHVYDRIHLDRIPRRYTVEAGKQLRDRWNTGDDEGGYDLWVLGPCGFHRSFRGAVPTTPEAARPEIKVRYDAENYSLKLVVFNRGRAPCEVTVQPNAYRTDGPWVLPVKARGRAQHAWGLGGSGNWYDFKVTAENFERRFAGRMETGESGVSDPEMGY
jgi:phospholipase C